jgi:hypothetical protein
MTTTRRRAAIGDTCWEVEWCEALRVDENGDGNPDRNKTVVRCFRDHDAALAYAREVFPKDQYGSVSITPMEFRPYDEDDVARYGPHVGYWEHTADAEYYEGE